MKIQKRVILVAALVLLVVNLINMVTLVTLTGRAVSESGTATICFNRPPAIPPIGTRNISSGSLFTYDINATDHENGTLTYFDNTTLFTINSSNGFINVTTNLSHTGTNDIKITVQDNVTDCFLNTSIVFTLNVSNAAPSWSTIPNQTWEEDVTLKGLDLDDYASDANGDDLNYTATFGPNINVTVDSSGVVTFKPDTDFNGITWVIFTANDSLNTADSNNVTLNVTPVANSCGDSICNADESCSSCTADCGSCPAGSAAAGGGGGGGSSAGRAAAAPRVAEDTCTPQIECTSWTPATCDGGARNQQRTCVNIAGDCSVQETTSERVCRCIPDWQCTSWQPDDCRDGIQERVCVDQNDCGEDRDLPRQRACEPFDGAAVNAEEARALAGQAFRSAYDLVTTDLGFYWIGVVIFLFVLALLLFLFKRKKDPQCGKKQHKGKGIEKHMEWFCSAACVDSYERANKLGKHVPSPTPVTIQTQPISERQVLEQKRDELKSRISGLRNKMFK